MVVGISRILEKVEVASFLRVLRLSKVNDAGRQMA